MSADVNVDDLTITGQTIKVPGRAREFGRGRMLAVLLVPLAMSQMSMSSINVAIPAIQQGLGASQQAVQLIISSYVLCFGIVLVAAGRIGDVLGRCATFVAGVTIFTLASLISATASTPSALIIGRLLQGIGSGVAMPQTNALIVQYFRGPARARAFSLWGPTVALSISLGPVLTGAFISSLGEQLGWRASFFWNVPIGLAAIAFALIWLPFEQERGASRPRNQKLDLDPVGMLLLSGSVLTLMLPFILRQPNGWWLLLLGAFGLVGWIAWERRYQHLGNAPMVDLALFKIRSFSNAIAISGTSFMAAPTLLLLIPLFLQQGAGVAAFPAGLAGVPNALATAVASIIAGRLVLGRGRTLSVAAQIINVCGVLLIFVLIAPVATGQLSFWWLAAAAMVPGFGVGLLNASNLTLAQLEIPPRVAGTAGGIKQTTERLGTAVGQAMLTGLLFAQLVSGWQQAMHAALLGVAGLFMASGVIALVDLRMLGNPKPAVTQ